MSAVVTVEDLVVGYGAVTAVEGINFAVEAGEQVTLLSPSGCGKTTILRAIAGLEHPRGGRIMIGPTTVYDADAGIDVAPEKRGPSMVFQSYAIWPHMSVAENVGFPLRVRGISRKAARPAVERALALVDLADFTDRPAMLDEPLSNLDAQLRIQMRSELVELRRRLAFTAIYVTHDQEEAFSLSDRIMVMRAGRIEQHGTPAEIHATPRTRFVVGFLGVRNIIDADIAGAAGDGAVEARLADGTMLRARDPWGGGRNGRAAVAFRPSAVSLEATLAAGRQGCAGTIARSLFTGDMAQVFVRCGPLEVCALVRPRPDFVVGSTVAWHVAPDDCLVLRE